MKFFQQISFALGLAGLAHAHMEMTYPAPFKSSKNPYADGDIDYSMTSPLEADGSNFPCKGYQTLFGTAKGKPTATFKAGSDYKMTITGGANHDGGSCQASLSFDKGKTFRVIHSYIGGCPVAGTSQLPFTVPSNTPSGEAIFAWTWFNEVGNREMYMNCAAVTITGGSSKRSDDEDFDDLDDLDERDDGLVERADELVKRADDLSDRPTIYVANVYGSSGCTTTEGKDVKFPYPGPDSDITTSGTNTYVPTCGGGSPGSSSDDSDSSSSAVASSPATTESQAATSAAATSAATSAAGGVFITVSSDTPAATSAATEVSDAPASTAPASTFSTLITVTKSSDTAVSATPAGTSSAAEATPSSGGSSGAYTAGTSCDDEGEWNCVGTTQFQRCASGKWSVLMAVASGTECKSGTSSALSISASSKRRRVFRRL